MANIGNPNELTPRQRRAIAALLSERDVRAAAQAARVGARTLYRWLTTPDFRAALTQAENETIGAASRRLLSGQDKALDALEDLIDGAPKDSDKRLAAVAWLDIALRWRELKNVEERLSALEEAVQGGKHK